MKNPRCLLSDCLSSPRRRNGSVMKSRYVKREEQVLPAPPWNTRNPRAAKASYASHIRRQQEKIISFFCFAMLFSSFSSLPDPGTKRYAPKSPPTDRDSTICRPLLSSQAGKQAPLPKASLHSSLLPLLHQGRLDEKSLPRTSRAGAGGEGEELRLLREVDAGL